MSNKLLSWILCTLLFCFPFSYAIASIEEDEQEVTITILDVNGNVVVGEPTPPPPTSAPDSDFDKSAPVYEADGSIKLLMSFGGDTTIGENVNSNGKSIFEKELAKQNGNINFPFRNYQSIFENDDLTVLNFEGTLTTEGINPSKRGNDFLFRADPKYVSMLNYGSVEAVALENNHVLDMGEAGWAETKSVLTDAGIAYASENEPTILTIKGVTIGLLAYQTFGGRHDEIIGLLPEAVQELRDKGCQIIIANYHWGAEKDYLPNSKQIKLGRASIDAGVDLVIGHHSHRINPIEYYKDRYICYSLGNFSFAGNSKPSDMSTFVFQIQLTIKEGELVSQTFRIIPSRISSRRDYNDFAPTPYTKGENIDAVIRLLEQYGKKLKYAVTDYPTKWLNEQ